MTCTEHMSKIPGFARQFALTQWMHLHLQALRQGRVFLEKDQ